MGDIRRQKKRYQTPMHPWSKSRIEEERELSREFGLRTKREIYKMNTVLKRYKDIAKRLIAQRSAQAQIEREHLMRKLSALGLIEPGATTDDILGLGIRDLLARRLQTVMVRRGMARSHLQARQFISHGHIMIGERKLTSPSYLVPVDEEQSITFNYGSALAADEHPERLKPEELEAGKEEKVREKKDEEEVVAFDEEEVKKAEENS